MNSEEFDHEVAMLKRDGYLEALRLAYDRGDLTDEEYEQRKDALERDT